MNERILAAKNLNINRFFTLDGKAYEEGSLNVLTKEFAGLSASMVLPSSLCGADRRVQTVQSGSTSGCASPLRS